MPIQSPISEVGYFAPRRCARTPIPELFECAWKLDQAVSAHLQKDRRAFAQLINETDMPVVRSYIESLWGSSADWPDQVHYRRLRPVADLLRRSPRRKERMPTQATKIAALQRDGFQCRYCGVPVVPSSVRNAMVLEYPELRIWGNSNATQHAAFQALWLQYDHIIPASFGGSNEIDNIVTACAGCNYIKMHFHIEEIGILNPLDFEVFKTNWDGLVRFFGNGKRFSLQ